MLLKSHRPLFPSGRWPRTAALWAVNLEAIGQCSLASSRLLALASFLPTVLSGGPHAIGPPFVCQLNRPQQPAVTDPSRAVATEVPDTGDQRGAGNKAGTKSRAGTQAVDAPLVG